MNVRSDARDAAVLAWVELVTRVRQVRGQLRQLVGVGFMTLLFGVAGPILAHSLALEYGGRLASGAVPLGDTGAILVGTTVVGTYVGSATAIQGSQLGSVGPLVRTSIPPTAVVVGRVASETVQNIVFVVPTAVALLAFVAVGAGEALPPLALVLAVVPVLLLTVLAGRIVGDVLRSADQHLQTSAWTKAVAFLAAMAAVFLGSQAAMSGLVLPAEGGEPVVSVPAFLPGAPLQAYASVVFAPLGSPVRSLGFVVATVVLAAIPLAFLLTVRFERALLLGEPAQAGDPTATVDASRAVPRLFRVSPSTRVAWRYLLRTRQDPTMLSHLFPLAVALLSFSASFFSSPEMALALGPGALVVVGAALSGGTYCLNPLGDDRDQLPLLLTSVRSPAVLLRGRAVAGVAGGLVFAWGLAVPLGLVSGSVTQVVARTLFAPVLLVAGAGTALGMGALVPKFERSEYLNVERAHPSLLVSMAYLFGAVVAGVVGLLLVGLVASDPTVVHAAILALYLAVIGGIAFVGYIYAVHRFDELTLDEV